MVDHQNKKRAPLGECNEMHMSSRIANMETAIIESREIGSHELLAKVVVACNP